MKPEIDPQKIRRKVYMTYFQDGFWDIVLGAFFLSWGLSVTFDLSWLPTLVFIAFFWLALGLKQKFTYPRIGYSKPVEQRRHLLRLAIAGAAALILGLFIMGMFAANGAFQWLRDYFELIFNSMLAVAIVLIAYWWRIVRWYVYAGLVFILAVSKQWLGLSFGLSFFIPGGIILVYGLVILTRFFLKYPAVHEESLNARR
jgi:hypothetical protein